ncbi:hypothetical protein LSTR_LSTR017060 [Laodelphax striatellus]|uniref:Uncharacterized protein n=1 Tax=Laodelphax striatellus TaxID=195883 RepID=A0A482WGF5_LAOST|nr:hypothetical protein LSTR_LSTR017060 [Laodelphax striatellus]
MLADSKQTAERKVLSQLLVQNKIFLDFMKNQDMNDFLNDVEAFGKFRLYLHHYICNSPFLLGNENMIKLVNAFVTYWLDLGYMTTRLHEADHEKTYFKDIKIFLEDRVAIRNLNFVDKPFLLSFSRDVELRMNIENAIEHRVEVVSWNKYNSDDERHFYERIFEMIDRGVFNDDIKTFLAWKTDTTTKMRALNSHISEMKQDIIECEQDE